MRHYRLYILDLDGTLYRGDEAIPNAVKTVRTLREKGALIRFLTNNSGQTRAFYQAKLQRLDFDPSPEEIYSSAIGAAKVCLDQGLKTVFYVGEPGLKASLEESGIEVLNSAVPSPSGAQTHCGNPATHNAQRIAHALIAGICRSFTYQWLNASLQQIIGGAQFIATNTDATYPVENGKLEPGAGAIVAAIQTCSGKDPIVIGKPNPLLINMVLKDAGVQPCDALAVGDRYETDILSGQNAGVNTHLVLTGVTRQAPEGQSFSDDLSGLLA